MTNITFLGTSANIPTSKRDNTSLLFTHRRRSFLIDCPGSISQKLLKAGVDYRTLSHLVITHRHPDHLYGLTSLLHTQAHSTPALTLYTHRVTQKTVKRLLDTFSLMKPPYPKITYVPVSSGIPFFTEKGLTLTAFSTPHIPGSFGVKFTFGKKSLFYSSDTAFSPALLQQAGRFDYLVHDCTSSASTFRRNPRLAHMHTHAGQLAGYCRRFPEVNIIPIHFLLEKKNEMALIKEDFRGVTNVTFPKEFQKLTL